MPSNGPTDEQVKLMRDAMLESYVRRNPEAQPEPGTSLYAVLEGAAGPIAAVMAAIGEDAEAAIHDFLEADREELVSPEPDPRAFERLVDRDPEPREADDWPCQRNSEGSF